MPEAPRRGPRSSDGGRRVRPRTSASGCATSTASCPGDLAVPDARRPRSSSTTTRRSAIVSTSAGPVQRRPSPLHVPWCCPQACGGRARRGRGLMGMRRLWHWSSPGSGLESQSWRAVGKGRGSSCGDRAKCLSPNGRLHAPATDFFKHLRPDAKRRAVGFCNGIAAPGTTLHSHRPTAVDRGDEP